MATTGGATQIAVVGTIQPLTPSLTFLSAAITTTVATTCSVPFIAASNFGPATPAMQPGFPASGTFDFKIDSEDFTCTAGFGTATWTITRGANSTTAATHLINAPITFMGTSGFTASPAAVTITDGISIKAHPNNGGIIGYNFPSSGWDINRCDFLVPGEGIDLTVAEVTNTNTGLFIVGTAAGDALLWSGA